MADEKKTALKWAEENSTGEKVPAWAVAAAKAMHLWPEGQEMTEAEFLASVQKAATVPIGGSPPKAPEAPAVPRWMVPVKDTTPPPSVVTPEGTPATSSPTPSTDQPTGEQVPPPQAQPGGQGQPLAPGEPTPIPAPTPAQPQGT